LKQINNWSALHFLASLGAGGMVVTFFGYIYMALSFGLIVLQFITGWLLIRLARKQLSYT